MSLILTKDNYFSPQNTAISNSKVSDFLKSKEFYKKKHLDHSIVHKQTANMKVGTCVDCFISGQPIPYTTKVLKRDNPDIFEMQKELAEEVFISNAQLEEAYARAEAIKKEPFFGWYEQNGAEFQALLQAQYRGIPICGMADIVTVTKKAVYIDDIKSVSKSKVRSPESWYWTCEEMGYLRQLAAYRYMWKAGNPKVRKPVECRHVVVYKEDENVYKVK